MLAVRSDEALSRVLSIMIEARVDFLPVMNGDRPVGCIREVDIINGVPTEGDVSRMCAEDLSTPVKTKILPESDITSAIGLMLANGEDMAFVIGEDGVFRGGVSLSDLSARVAGRGKGVSIRAGYRAIINLSANPMFLLKGKRILFINGQLASLLGLGISEIVGEEISRFLHPMDAVRFEAEIRDRRKREAEGEPFVFRGIVENGEDALLEASLRVVGEAEESLLLGTLRDITGATRLQSELEREYSTVNLLWMLTNLFLNWGREHDAALKKAAELIVKFSEADSCALIFPQVAAEKGIIRASAETRDGKVHAFNPMISMDFLMYPALKRSVNEKDTVILGCEDEDASMAEKNHMRHCMASFLVFLPLLAVDRLIGIVVLGLKEEYRETFADELPRYLAVADQMAFSYEKARIDGLLRESEAQYRELFENAFDIVFKVDKAGLIEDINSQFTISTGYDVANWIGRPFMSILADEKQAGAKLVSESSNRFAGAEFAFGTDFGVKYYYVSSWPRFGYGGDLIGNWRVARDITEQKLKEMELVRLKEKAEKASKAKSSFIANISHELRTPLTTIIGFGKLIGGDAGVSEETREQGRVIAGQGQDLLKLINDILDFVDTEKLVKSDGRLDRVILEDIVERAISVGEELASGKPIDFSASIQPSVFGTIKVDEQKLFKVLCHLVGNAVKFTEEGKIEISVSTEGGKVVFRVSDTGIGIAEENYTRIFESFEQGDSSMTRKYGGIGLGLPLARSTVISMGGDIWVQSRAGKGSSFYFSFPLLYDNGRRLSDASRAFHVLVVDDDFATRVLIHDTLSKADIRSSMAANGKEAVGMCSGESYDLVLMNISMPIMGGYEAIAKMREIPHYIHIPIVAVTGRTMKGDREKILGAGFNDYIPKPFNPLDLLKRVQNMLSGIRLH